MARCPVILSRVGSGGPACAIALTHPSFAPSAECKSGMRGFAGCLPNEAGFVPPMSDDFWTKLQIGPSALVKEEANAGGNTDKFYATQ